MPWKSMQVREQRVEFVVRALLGGEPLSRLCVEFGISRPTGYCWLARYREGGVAAIEERSRRPHESPTKTGAELETQVVALRKQYPDWGARKLAVLLARQGIGLPSSTIHRVLLRHGLVRDEDRHTPAVKRFERDQSERTVADGLQGTEELAQVLDGPVGNRRSQPLRGGA
jgi:transposase